MPEGLEIEYYRRLAERGLGRVIASVDAPDGWYLKRGLSAEVVRDRLVGSRFVAARRQGKLLLLDLGGPAGERRGDDLDVLGLRFGMTGVLDVDDEDGVDQLEYSSQRRDPAWIRFAVTFADGGGLRMRDPRRLGGVELDPDLRRLGPDALSLSPSELRRAAAGSAAPIKARLMDQSRVSGLGNLLVDEILWRSGIDPTRPAGTLEDRDLRRLHRHLRGTLADLLDRGGSHTGDLMVSRRRGGLCPRCGTPLDRRTVGGRTTYSCPRHQR